MIPMAQGQRVDQWNKLAQKQPTQIWKLDIYPKWLYILREIWTRQ